MSASARWWPRLWQRAGPTRVSLAVAHTVVGDDSFSNPRVFLPLFIAHLGAILALAGGIEEAIGPLADAIQAQAV